MTWNGRRRFHFLIQETFLIDLNLGCDASWWVGGFWGKRHCREHPMLLPLVMALAGSPVGLVGYGWSWPLGLNGPLLWTDVTCFHLCGTTYLNTILCALWATGTLLHLSKHLSQNCLSALFPNNPEERSRVGRGGGFVRVQGGFALLYGYKPLSWFVAGFFGLVYGFRLWKLVTETAHRFPSVPPFSGK